MRLKIYPKAGSKVCQLLSQAGAQLGAGTSSWLRASAGLCWHQLSGGEPVGDDIGEDERRAEPEAEACDEQIETCNTMLYPSTCAAMGLADGRAGTQMIVPPPPL